MATSDKAITTEQVRATDCGCFGRVSERALEKVAELADDVWDREVCRLELARRALL